MGLHVQFHNAAAEPSHLPGNLGLGDGRYDVGPSRLSNPTVGLLVQTQLQARIRATPLAVPQESLPGADSEYHTH